MMFSSIKIHTKMEEFLSIQVTPAILRVTVARNFFTFILIVKMVIICYLFSRIYVSFSKKHNLHISI